MVAKASAMALVDHCVRLGLSIATAESLTGGLLAAEIVAVPGASRVFRGGVVAYDTALKASLLGVDCALLEREGPVHREVAEQMAEGVRQACAIDGRPVSVGIATTGVAGPAPDAQTGQLPGTVWIGWSVAGELGSALFQLAGDRQAVRETTVALTLRQMTQNLSLISSSSGLSRE